MSSILRAPPGWGTGENDPEQSKGRENVGLTEGHFRKGGYQEKPVGAATLHDNHILLH